MKTVAAARIAETYAQSLLELARESGIVDAVETDLETVSILLTQEPSFQAFLASPYFAEQTKRDLIRKVFTGRLDRITVNFLSVVIDHDRGGLLPEILDQFRQRYRTYCGYQTVTAVVAQPLREEQTTKLSQELAEALKAKVDLEVRVDPSIIGGVIFHYGDKMVDNSVRGRLVRTVGRIVNPENRQRQ